MRAILAFPLLLAAAPLHADSIGEAQVQRIVTEGSQHSQVMQTAQHLSDVIGPRMTNSPAMRTAEAWTQGKYREWGLTNVHKEGFDFGRGWWIERSSVRMVSPRPLQLTAIPIAWTPGTTGPLTAAIVVAPMTKSEHFAAWRGKLRGKIVLVSKPGATAAEPDKPAFQRLSDEELGKLDSFEEPVWNPESQARTMKRARFDEELTAFLAAEGAVAYVAKSRLDGKLVHGEGYQYLVGRTPKLPGIELAAEDYRRLARLAVSGTAPTLEIDSLVHFEDADRQAYNVIADIKGSDPSAGYVMAGAHLDSWVAGDGAADNGAGSAMVMEAARILSAMGVRPKRTIRFALWAGEEQALLGSIAYIEQHLATRPKPPGQSADELYYSYATQFPITPLAGYKDLAAYFNIDNGSGKIRGIYAENNLAAVPIFNEWLAPFASMGANRVVIQKTFGTDHQFMQAAGLPGFQFIQDPLDYESSVHHTQIDTFDHLKGQDMRQGAIILAAFLLNAAQADKPLPRLPLPTTPGTTDPFTTPDPDEQ